MLPVRSHSTLVDDHDTNGMHKHSTPPPHSHNRRSLLHSPYNAQQGPFVTVISSPDLSLVNRAKLMAVVFSTNAATYQCLHKIEYIRQCLRYSSLQPQSLEGEPRLSTSWAATAYESSPIRSTGSVISSPPLCNCICFVRKSMLRMQRIQ